MVESGNRRWQIGTDVYTWRYKIANIGDIWLGPVIRRLYSPLHQLTRAVRFQKDTPLATPLNQRLTTLRHGFRSSRYILYDFEQNDPKAYLPDTVFREATAINGTFCRRVLEDKLLFTRFFGDIFKVPEVFALVERGRFYPLTAQHTFSDLLSAYGGAILKPVLGWQGQGILSVSEENGKLSVNGRPSSLSALEQTLGQLDGYLVTERIVQDGYAHTIFPGSVNSVRVTTMQHPDENHRPFSAVAVHRFGSSTTGPTDNVHRGGLMAQINLETGTMGPAIGFPHETGGELRGCSHHPDTGAPIENVRVPGWDALQTRLLRLIETFPFFRYVGWDIVLTQDVCWLIEGNHNPSPAVQMFHPYLGDPEIRRFFEFYGVI